MYNNNNNNNKTKMDISGPPLLNIKFKETVHTVIGHPQISDVFFIIAISPNIEDGIRH